MTNTKFRANLAGNSLFWPLLVDRICPQSCIIECVASWLPWPFLLPVEWFDPFLDSPALSESCAFCDLFLEVHLNFPWFETRWSRMCHSWQACRWLSALFPSDCLAGLESLFVVVLDDQNSRLRNLGKNHSSKGPTSPPSVVLEVSLSSSTITAWDETQSIDSKGVLIVCPMGVLGI